MEGYTLISSIGTGMYKKEGGYRDTVYKFPDGTKYETRIFLKAILETKYHPIKKVILIGTTSSSWDVLIPAETEKDFWTKIKNECENNVFSDESKNELGKKLSEWNNDIKFEIVVHSNEFNHDNVEKIFAKYLDIPDLIEPETKILFDITHGFRSMPLLIFQSLQLNAVKIYGRKVELIYGEFIEEEKISYVRDLSDYWDYYEISSAIKLFDDKLNGRVLAYKINKYWEKGYRCLLTLSDIVECNFSLQIRDALKEIKEALKDYNEKGKPQWVNDVRDKLNDIYKKLKQNESENYPLAKTIWEYSKLLRKKNLLTQAIIALQVVTETAIAEKYDPSKIGDFAWFNGYFDNKLSKKVPGEGEKYFKNIRNKNNFLNPPLNQLEVQRNQIAHGGGIERKTGKYPSQAEIKRTLETIDEAIKELFTALNKEK